MQRCAVLFGGLTVVLCGCGGDSKIAPVSGVVTLNGKPVADVAVSFQPIATSGNNNPGPASFGVTGPDGKYAAKILGEDRKGAAVGKNQVRFSAHMPPSDPDNPVKTKPTVQIPGRYWYDSKLEFDVPQKGTSSADFKLTSP